MPRQIAQSVNPVYGRCSCTTTRLLAKNGYNVACKNNNNIFKEEKYMSKLSKELRDQMRRHGVKQWQVANALGVSESTLIRWMRVEPSAEHAAMIAEAIEGLATKEV